MPLRKFRESEIQGRMAFGLQLVEPALPLEEILIKGGDARLALASDRRNSYGCTPFPRAHVLDFGSSTASNISETAYACVQNRQAQLWLDTARLGASPALDKAVDHARQKLRNLLGITGAEIVFSPSGTDAQLQVLFLATGLLGRPLTTIIAGADQTGSGTAHTARGHHFSDRTSLGIDVQKGTAASGLSEHIRTISVPFCDAAGRLRTAREMDGAIHAAVADAVGRGEKVLLQAMDSSKLGWRAPSIACIDRIAATWPDEVCVVIDACQLRVGRERLKDYLARGYLVLLTGSKFFTGPAFSGALLIPQSKASHVDTSCGPAFALCAYSTCHDWPPHWQNLRAALPAQCNHGQWLRWEAALHEMEEYFAVPPGFRDEFFRTLAIHIPSTIAASCGLELVAPPQGPADTGREGEMHDPTIFPFVPHHAGEALPPEHCAGLYRAMGQDLSGRLSPNAPDDDRRLARQVCQIGQPVTLGHVPGAALRICVSARHASTQWRRSQSIQDAVQSVLTGVRAVVGKLDWLVANPHLREGY
jgi:hypothetical protein